MQLAETVTFGGSGLDRRAELRALAPEIAKGPTARTVVVWRGKVLVDGDGLKRLTSDSSFLKHAKEAPVYIGQDDGIDLFGQDCSTWEPPEGIPDTLGAFTDPSRQAVQEIGERVEFAELRSIMSDLTARDAEIAATAKAILGWHSTHQFCSKCGAATQVSDGGWRRDCLSCAAQHFPRTDPVVIMLITHGNSVLLGRSPGWPDGMYSLLAGFVEPGETIEAAVRREVAEESSIKVGQVGYLASQPWPFPSSLMFGCWGQALTTDISIDPNELEDAIWVSREEMASVFSGDHHKIRAPRRGAIAGFILEHWLKDRLD